MTCQFPSHSSWHCRFAATGGRHGRAGGAPARECHRRRGRAATTPRRATNVAAAVGTTVAARALTALALPFRRVPASRLRRPAPQPAPRRFRLRLRPRPPPPLTARRPRRRRSPLARRARAHFITAKRRDGCRTRPSGPSRKRHRPAVLSDCSHQNRVGRAMGRWGCAATSIAGFHAARARARGAGAACAHLLPDTSSPFPVNGRSSGRELGRVAAARQAWLGSG